MVSAETSSSSPGQGVEVDLVAQFFNIYRNLEPGKSSPPPASRGRRGARREIAEARPGRMR
jgi:hypothetical protein